MMAFFSVDRKEETSRYSTVISTAWWSQDGIYIGSNSVFIPIAIQIFDLETFQLIRSLIAHEVRAADILHCKTILDYEETIDLHI